MNYSFNYHPKNIKELEKIILNLPKMNKKIKKKEILEFFFMHHILPSYDWLGRNIKELVKESKSLKLFYSSIDTYHSIAQRVNEVEVLQSLKTFLSTDNYILEKKYDKNTNFKNVFNK